MRRLILGLATFVLGGLGWPGAETNGPLGLFSLRADAAYVLTVYGDFNGDQAQDRLDMVDNPYGWWVLLGGQSTWTQWLSGVAPGQRNHVGDFDGDGKDDLLLYSGQWNLFLSTGQGFSPRLNVNPGFTLGAPQECAKNYDADPASELIMESTYNTCWQYDAGQSKFNWKHCSRTCAFPTPLFYAEDDQLYSDGGAPVFLRGTTYMGCRGVTRYAFPAPPIPVEHADPWLFLLVDCPPDKVRPDLSYLRDNLHVNTVRVLTPSPAINVPAEYGGKWFQEPPSATPGAITPEAQQALQGLFDVGRELGVRITVVLYPADDYPAPNTPAEERAYRYVESLAEAFKDEPALFSYELISEALVDGNNWGDVNGDQQRAARALSFHARMAARLKANDGNHLITSGQVSTLDRTGHNQLWHFPSAEFSAIPDIHGLNAGVPFNLYSRIDYLSPHLYAGDQCCGVNRGTTGEMASTLSKVKIWRDQQLVRKPITLGEAGYEYPLLDVPTTAHVVDQDAFFVTITGVLETIAAKGLLMFNALPQLPLYSGTYTSAQEFPPNAIVTYTLNPPTHLLRTIRVHAGDLWNLFYPVKLCGLQPPPGGCLANRPAAVTVRDYFAAHP